MATKTAAFRLKETTIARMRKFRADAGVSQTAQVEKAVNAWLTEQEQFRAQLRKSLDARKGGK